MPPKKSKVGARAAGMASAAAGRKRAEEAAKREHLGRNLRRSAGELIPKDAVRAMLHTFHILTGRKDESGGEGLTKGQAISKTSNLLGYDAATVRSAVAAFMKKDGAEIPVKNGAGRGHGKRKVTASEPGCKRQRPCGSRASCCNS